MRLKRKQDLPVIFICTCTPFNVMLETVSVFISEYSPQNIGICTFYIIALLWKALRNELLKKTDCTTSAKVTELFIFLTLSLGTWTWRRLCCQLSLQTLWSKVCVADGRPRKWFSPKVPSKSSLASAGWHFGYLWCLSTVEMNSAIKNLRFLVNCSFVLRLNLFYFLCLF